MGKDEAMTAWICATCGVQYPNTPSPPESCPICEDPRQYVGWDGQAWISPADLLAEHRTEIRVEEPGLIGIGVEPSFGIGQRALVVLTPGGNVMWDCVPALDESAKAALAAVGGIDAICFSHPHFYGAYPDWAAHFGAIVYIPRADARWAVTPSPNLAIWEGDRSEPVAGVTLMRVGGHFEGSCILHVPQLADSKGAILVGDTLQVVKDRRWLSFMRSYPNFIPLGVDEVSAITAKVGDLGFDRIYGGWWDATVPSGGRDALERSARRYQAAFGGDYPPESDPL